MPIRQDILNICSTGVTTFFMLETLDRQIRNANRGLLKKDDVESLRSQGSAFLYHTVAANYGGGQNSGISQVMHGQKACGAAKGKYLARVSQGGSEAGVINNDNYIYYTISRFMMKKFNVCVAPNMFLMS